MAHFQIETRAEIIDIGRHTPNAELEFFVDTNVWYYRMLESYMHWERGRGQHDKRDAYTKYIEKST